MGVGGAGAMRTSERSVAGVAAAVRAALPQASRAVALTRSAKPCADSSSAASSSAAFAAACAAAAWDSMASVSVTPPPGSMSSVLPMSKVAPSPSATEWCSRQTSAHSPVAYPVNTVTSHSGRSMLIGRDNSSDTAASRSPTSASTTCWVMSRSNGSHTACRTRVRLGRRVWDNRGVNSMVSAIRWRTSSRGGGSPANSSTAPTAMGASDCSMSSHTASIILMRCGSSASISASCTRRFRYPLPKVLVEATRTASPDPIPTKRCSHTD